MCGFYRRFNCTKEGVNMARPMTMAEKILAAHAHLDEVEPGQLIECDLDLVLSNDITSPIAIKNFKKIGVDTHKVKNCMIIGGGKTSYYLGKQLISSGVEVKILELDEKRCEELSVLLPKALILHGDGSDEDLLREEGIESTESFVPLTGLDEENILLTLFARKCSDTKVITKINRSTFSDVLDSLDIGSIVYPRYITAEKILAYIRAMQNSVGSNIETLYHIFDNRAEALEFKVEKDSPVIGKPIMELKLKDNLLLACLNRNGKVIIPRGQDVICEGDYVVVVTTHTGFTDVSDILKWQ